MEIIIVHNLRIISNFIFFHRVIQLFEHHLWKHPFLPNWVIILSFLCTKFVYPIGLISGFLFWFIVLYIHPRTNITLFYLKGFIYVLISDRTGCFPLHCYSFFLKDFPDSFCFFDWPISFIINFISFIINLSSSKKCFCIFTGMIVEFINRVTEKWHFYNTISSNDTVSFFLFKLIFVSFRSILEFS